MGQNPVAVAASPTRNEVYVVNSGAPAAARAPSPSSTPKTTPSSATIPVHRQPVAIALDPDGDAGLRRQLRLQQRLRPRPEGPPRDRRIGAGEQPVALRLSPDGKTLVVANRGGNSVSLIDPATRQVRAVFGGCPGASDVVILPDSSKAFAACSGGHQVMAIALAHAGNATQSGPASPTGLNP